MRVIDDSGDPSMNDTQDNEKFFYRFLLGEAPPDEQEQFEIRLLEDAELQEVIQAAEFDLIDDYIRGDLTAREARSFERNFLNSPARRRKLELARIILNPHETTAEKSLSNNVTEMARLPTHRRSQKLIVRRPFIPIAAGVLLLVGIGTVAWRVFLPWWQVRQGLAMLNETYHQGRPIEPRLSGFRYASWEKDRSGDDGIDYTLRDQARLTLLNAARAHPSAKAYQALGSSYLLNREVKEAIDQFNKSLKYDPSNARVHNDLGTALMESARSKQREFDQLRGKSPQGAEQISAEIFSDLSLANEHFSQALQIDGKSTEAMFNQALCLERLGLIDQALATWEKYLQLDPQSEWAAEAKERVEALKKRKDKTFFDNNRIFQNFLSAYHSGDEEAIWQSFILGSRQKGNCITELLLDQYLESLSQGRRAEAQDKLDVITTAGRIEAQKSGDLYTRDMAAFYRTISPQQVNLLSAARRIIKEAREKNKKSKQEALELYRQARQIFTRAGSTYEIAMADLVIGSISALTEDYSSAMRLARALTRESEERSYLWLNARALWLTANLYVHQNRPAQAIEYSKLALSIAERKQDWNERVEFLGQLADAHWFLGSYEQSLTYARQALYYASIYPVEPEILWYVCRISADALNSISRLFTSTILEKEALRLAIEMKRPLQISRSYGFLSESYGRLKNYHEAIGLARKDLEIGNEHSSDPMGSNIQAHAFLRLGHLYRETGEFDESLNAYNECIRISESRRILYESLDARRGRLLVYLANHDYPSAKTELNKAIDLFEKNRDEIDDAEMKTRFFETGHDIYDLGIQLSQHDYKLAFRYSEEGRARSLLDMMRPMGGRSLNGLTTGSINRPLILSQIADHIPASVQIIQYSLLSESLYVWVLSDSDFFGVDLGIQADDLSRKVNEYLECINDQKLDDRATLLAKELYEILIKPVETRLNPDKEIFIVADKPFNHFPFVALIEPATGKYLIEKYTISFSPSSTVFIHCANIARQKESLSVEHCLSIGQSEFKQSSLRNFSLPSTKKEAEQVASYYRSNSKVLVDSAATESSVRQEISNAEVIHIATHNLVNERRPGLSGLALWEEADASTPNNDGMLQAEEISRLKLPRAKLVVLSACQTWIGRDYYGEGMVGMARAFIAAGSPVVVASLWNINSQTTAKFMDGFHRRRAGSGITTARAIRETQIEMLRGVSAGYRRPSAWAGFIVVGGYARF